MREKFSWIFVVLVVVSFTFAGLIYNGWAETEEDVEHGGTIIYTKPVKAVIFDHQFHLDQGLECDSCHDEIFEEATGTAEENGDFVMQSLYDGKYCGACHDGETAFASNTRCATCHIGVKGFNRLHKVEAGGADKEHH